MRVEGSDGNISCTVTTDILDNSGDFLALDGVKPALPGQHYQHMTRQVQFAHNQSEALVNLTIIANIIGEDEEDDD